MIRDIGILLWSEGKRLRHDLAYWLTLLGYDPTSSFLYRIYFFLFWLFWLLTSWGTAIQQVYQISQGIPLASSAALISLAPSLVLLLQLLWLVQLLRDPPLKLNAPEMTYVAASPVHRGAVALTQFLRRLLAPATGISLASTLLSMLLSWRGSPDQVGYIGLKTLLLTFPLVYATAGLAWAVALLKLRRISRLTRLLFWLVPPLVALVAVLLPGVGLWMGSLWAQAVENSLSVDAAVGVALLTVVALCLLVVAGERVHLALVADNSLVYARLQRLGMFGRFYASDVIERIHRQARLAKKKRLRLAMPANQIGYSAFLSRSTLSLLRLAPGTIVRPLLRGISLTAAIATLVSIGGWRALPLWILAVLFAILNRPTEIVASFRETMGLPFMRQFLPDDPLAVFAASAFYPFLLTAVGCLGVLLVLGWGTNPLVIVLALLSLLALGLAQALESIEGRGILGRTIPYAYTVIAYAVVVVGAGLLIKSLAVTVGAAVLVNVVLGLLLNGS